MIKGFTNLFSIVMVTSIIYFVFYGMLHVTGSMELSLFTTIMLAVITEVKTEKIFEKEKKVEEVEK